MLQKHYFKCRLLESSRFSLWKLALLKNYIEFDETHVISIQYVLKETYF